MRLVCCWQAVPGQPWRLRVGSRGPGRHRHSAVEPDGRQRTPASDQGKDTGDTGRWHHAGPSR